MTSGPSASAIPEKGKTGLQANQRWRFMPEKWILSPTAIFFFPPVEILPGWVGKWEPENVRGNSGSYCSYWVIALNSFCLYQNSACASLGIPPEQGVCNKLDVMLFISKAGNGIFVEIPLREEMMTFKLSSKEKEVYAVIRFPRSILSSRAKNLLPLEWPQQSNWETAWQWLHGS